MPAKNERVCDVHNALTLRQRLEHKKSTPRCLDAAASNHETRTQCTKEKAYQQVQMDAHPQAIVKYSTSWFDCPSLKVS